MASNSSQPTTFSADEFDRIPDPIVLIIFNNISDVKTLIRCRAVSRRFNSLVPESDSLVLKVDRVISSTESDDGESVLITIVRSIFKSIQELMSPKPLLTLPRSQNSPAQILRGFERIRELEIELPSGDLRLEKRAVIKWKAEFGKTLKSCVILGFRGGGEEAELGGGELKARVVWTISALIAASARHYMIKDVVREHEDLSRLIVRDREGEGTVLMNSEGLREYREKRKCKGGEEEEEEEEEEGHIGNNGVWWRNNRTTVPEVRMKMRHEPRLELGGGVRMEGATLVVVRPSCCGEVSEAEEEGWDAELAAGAFEGVYGEAVEKLLKRRSFLLEMNSF